MRKTIFGFAVFAAAAAGCARPDSAATRAAVRPHYLADVPVIPGSVVLDTTGTPDADHAVLRTLAPMDSVVAFYRRALPAHGWHIVADMADAAHASLYATRDDKPLWIQIRNAGSMSEVNLTAAGVSGQDTAVRGAPP
jgi:hypothetical protein